MNQFSRNVALLSVFAVSVFVCLIGCSEPAPEESGPSYADLVTVYNAELQSLDRLERKREERIAKHEVALRPSTEDAAKALDATLSSAKEVGKQSNLDGVTDPNELLDRAVEHAEKAQDNPRRRKAKKEDIQLASWMTRAQYDLLLSVVED